MINNNTWFSEVNSSEGIAFSLKITQKLHEEKTQFQKIEIFKTEAFGNLMVIDGCIMLTSRDNHIYHEMMSHPALFLHPNPEYVLIIGGGDCGTLTEVLKHDNIKNIHQIDIDKRVTTLAEKYFPELCECNNDNRINFSYTDGMKWVQESSDKKYDIIIVDSTDPVGPGKILFSKEFFSHCNRVLKNDGIFIGQSESPFLHIDKVIRPMHRDLLASGFKNLSLLTFPLPTYPSGWWSCTLASLKTKLKHPKNRKKHNIGVKTRYYNDVINYASTVITS